MKFSSLSVICLVYSTAGLLWSQTVDKPALTSRPFVVSADLREAYDDNIFTTHSDRTASGETIIEPSFLFTYPQEDTTFSARYTMDATAYYNRQSTWDLAHDFLARVNHSFNDRFNLDVRDRVHYAQQPEVDEGAVVARVTGDYINNTFTTQGSMQWTPKYSTVTTFTNDYFDYRTTDQSGNDRMSNVLSNDLRYDLLPNATLVYGASYTNLDYFHEIANSVGTPMSRDWQSLSPYVGVDYFFTPEWSVSPRVGITYTTYDASTLSDSVTPYASLTTDWKIGKRSSLSFNYTHNVAQTDLINYSSQISDSFSLTGRYQATPLIETHITSFYNIGQNEGDTSLDPNQATVNENTLGIGTGASYDVNHYLSLETGYNLDYITSDITERAYTRNVVYIGVRVTY